MFDRQLGLNRLMRVRDEIARAAKFFSEASLATSPDYATAFLAVGHDSVLGSLGTSLVAILREGDGTLLSDLDWPPFLPRTGVPYIERIASNDGEIQGFRFTGGDRFRLFLDACPARGHAGEDAAFFGKGRHVCLGKDLSQWLW